MKLVSDIEAAKSAELDLGLFQKATIVKLGFDSTPQGTRVFSYDVSVGGRQIFASTYLNVNEVDRLGQPLTQQQKAKQVSEIASTILHVLKAVGVEEEKVVKALEGVGDTDLGALEVALTPFTKGAVGKEVDVFLQYQYKIGSNADRTYLELPSNLRGGLFMTQPVEGSFKKVVSEKEGIYYLAEDGKTRHPLSKSALWMESPNAKMQVKKKVDMSTSDESFDPDAL